MKEFRFQLGEVVTTKESIAQAMLECQGGAFANPRTCTVVQRSTDECHGGTQHTYICSVMGETKRINDTSLAPLSDFDPAKAMNVALDAATESRDRRYPKTRS